jgi:hypothetical protein
VPPWSPRAGRARWRGRRRWLDDSTAVRCGGRALAGMRGGTGQDERGGGSPSCLGVDTAVGGSGAAAFLHYDGGAPLRCGPTAREE